MSQIIKLWVTNKAKKEYEMSKWYWTKKGQKIWDKIYNKSKF